MSAAESRLLPHKDTTTARKGGGIATWTHIDRQSLPAWLERAIKQTEERAQFEPSDAEIKDLLKKKARGFGDNEQAAYEMLTGLSKFVIHEDADLLVLNKPPGLISTSRNNFKFSLEAMARRLRGDNTYAVNRLDRETSGIIVLTKTPEAFIDLKHQFADKEQAKMDKVYLALVDGEFKDASEKHVDLFIGDPDARNTRVFTAKPGEQIPTNVEMKDSHTIFSPLVLYHTKERLPRPKTLVAVRILTGRTHQIRAAASVGLEMPVTGDSLYGGRKSDAPRQMLHAFGLTFNHPTTGESVTVNAPVPPDFEKVIRDDLTVVKSYQATQKS